MRSRLINRANKSVIFTLPAPIKGLNCRDGIADMEATYAITMDNYIPGDTKVVLRQGYRLYAALNAPVGTLATYNNGIYSRLLAVAGGYFWNISSRENIYKYSDIKVFENNCQTAQYKDYLYFVNGLDNPKVYHVDENGDEHLEDWGFTGDGLLPGRIINVSVSKQRLWFVEKDSLKVWYTKNAGEIAGELDYFDLSQICRFGGHLVAVANWTQDGGQGIDDLTVFLTSEGEVLVYSGSDINNAEDWKLRGSYKISRPIGYKCWLPYQGDVIIISEDGYIPLSGALPVDKANASQIAFSDNIRGLVLERTQKYADQRGWCGLIYGRGGYAIFNVPLSSSFEQHVINVNTGAWCRFTGINAFCWGEYDKRLYFGSGDSVYLFDEGYSDGGKAIHGRVEQAYTNLGTERLKKIQLLNPRTKALFRYMLTIYTNMDMEQGRCEYSEEIGNIGTALWNRTKWAAATESEPKWGDSGRSRLRSQWLSNSATGYKASIVFATSTNGNNIEWYETGIRYELGEGIL